MVTVGYFIAFIALGLVAASLGPTLPGLAAHTNSQLSEISFLFTGRSSGYMIGSFLSGRLYDRVPGHPLIVVCLLFMALLMALAPVVSWLWLLAAVLLLLGITEGFVDVGGNTLLVWDLGDRVGPFMNGLHFFFGLGAFISPIIIAQAVLASGDINWAYWGLALLMIPPAVWLWRLPSPEAVKSAVTGAAVRSNQILLAITVLFFFLYVGAEVGFGGWVYTYAVSLDLLDETVAAYLTSVFWGALTLGRLLSIPIAKQLRPRTILLVDMVGCVVSVGTILFWPRSPIALWAGAFGLGLFMASIFPTTISLAERRMPITGKTTSWFLVGSSLGAMTLPWIIGQLFDAIGPQVTMRIMLFDLLAATAVFVVLITFSSRLETVIEI